MNLDQASRWRNLAGWVGGGLCLLAFLTLLDGLIGQFREPANLIKLLPGMTAEIDGPLQEEVRGVQELTFVSDTADLKLSFATVHKGYFLGGNLWRGQITASPRLQPGAYHLAVLPRWSKLPKASLTFRVVVYPDLMSLRRSSKSMIRRQTGLSPWGVAAACLPGILLAFGTVYLLSGKLEALLAASGKAEIYQVIRGDGGYEIRFGLGAAQGLSAGVLVSIHNPKGQSVGTATVEVSSETDSTARVTTDQEIKPGFWVSKEI